MSQTTIPSYYANVLLEKIKSRSINRNELLIKSGIPLNINTNHLTRISSEQFSKLLKNVQSIMQDEGMGYYLQPQKIGTTNILISHMSTASNVKAAFECAVQFYDILNLGISLSLIDGDDYISLKVDIDKRIQCEWVYEEVMTKIHRIVRWLANERISLHKVKMPFAKVGHIKEYHLLFGCPVEFDAPNAEIIFLKSCASILLHRSHDDVRQHFKDFRYHILSLTVDPKSYVEKVRIAIKDNLPEDCSYEKISKQLSMHPQTLRRRLHDEGTEFSAIKNNVIRDLAIQYISQKELSIKQIAFLLNFSAPSSFNRAFKQWTGLSPAAFQKSLEELPEKQKHNLLR